MQYFALSIICTVFLFHLLVFLLRSCAFLLAVILNFSPFTFYFDPHAFCVHPHHDLQRFFSFTFWFSSFALLPFVLPVILYGSPDTLYLLPHAFDFPIAHCAPSVSLLSSWSFLFPSPLSFISSFHIIILPSCILSFPLALPAPFIFSLKLSISS